jgi:hypothetical protein
MAAEGLAGQADLSLRRDLEQRLEPREQADAGDGLGMRP